MTCPALAIFLIVGAVGFPQTIAQHSPTASPPPELVRAEAAWERAVADLRRAEEEARAAQETLERMRALFARGLIARRDLEWAELQERTAQAQVAAAREVERWARQTLERAREFAEKAARRERDPSRRTAVRIARSYGNGRWTMADLTHLMRAYQKRFGTPLPISALGHTPTHDRLGLDHRGRVDVALHPESEPGRWVIEYLTRRGIPYITFGEDVPQSSTGAHIHIGPPSARK